MPRKGPWLLPSPSPHPGQPCATSHKASASGERRVWHANQRLTCGKPHFLVALGKFNIKIGDKGMDVVIALYLQAEGRREGQLFCFHRVNVHLLQPRGERM